MTRQLLGEDEKGRPERDGTGDRLKKVCVTLEGDVLYAKN